MAEDFSSRYFRGSGRVFVGPYADSPGNLVFIGDAAVEATADVQRTEVVERVSGSRGIGASLVDRTQFNLTLNMRSIKPDHLAAAIRGTSTTVAASSVTDEAHTAKLGRFSKLAHGSVSSVVVTGTGGTPTYVAGTDYTVHAEGGMIEWLAGGTIGDDDPAEIDYDYAAQHDVDSAPDNVPVHIVVDAINEADGGRVQVDFWRVKLDPGAFPPIGDNPAEATLNGVVERDDTRSAGDQFFRTTSID